MTSKTWSRRRYVVLAVGAVFLVVVCIVALIWAVTPVEHIISFPLRTNCADVVKSFPAEVTITWVVPNQVPVGSGAYYANVSSDRGSDVQAVAQAPGSYGVITGVTSPAKFSACPFQGAPIVNLTVQAEYWIAPV